MGSHGMHNSIMLLDQTIRHIHIIRDSFLIEALYRYRTPLLKKIF